MRINITFDILSMRTAERKQLTRDLFIYYKGFQKLRVTLQRLQRDLKKTDISKVCQLQRHQKHIRNFIKSSTNQDVLSELLFPYLFASKT